MRKKAIIISIKGLKLTNKERLLLSKEKPWGLILFKRNIETLNQIKDLIQSVKKATRDNKFPIIIDEEGSNVSRLKKIICHNVSANFFGELYKIDSKISIQIYKNYLTKLCKILKKIGFNINTIPVLDVLRTHTNKVIGERSFSNNKTIVQKLGKITVEHCNTYKIATVAKHIPGHGSAISDSHFTTPRVNLDQGKLKNTDFYPFKFNPAQFAMTAHILYTKIDKKNVATLSKKIIYKIIRKKIGFKGILISDDISMKALKYDLVTSAIKSLEAGCNLVLYCAGNIDENFKLIKSVPFIDKFTLKKTSEFYKFLG
jgi:beta-N-acetylhexosaminidase